MGNQEGVRFDIGDGMTFTANPADNPANPGGWYQTTTDSDGNKSTAVYDADGNMPSGMGDNDQYK